MRTEVRAIRGHVEQEVADEFPDVALWSVSLDAWMGKSSPMLRERLTAVGDRVAAIAVGVLRTDSIAAAYRAFARQIGLDPDVERNPLEQAAFERLAKGAFVSRDRIRDTLLIAMLETGVPLWALDARQVHGPIRVAQDSSNRIVIADDRREHAAVLRAPEGDVVPGRTTERIVVYALRVKGVPHTTVEEALWHVASMLTAEAR